MKDGGNPVLVEYGTSVPSRLVDSLRERLPALVMRDFTAIEEELEM